MMKKLPLRFTSLAFLTATFSVPVHAAESGVRPGGALEEVIVSARRRAEMLEDTPIPVSAYTSEQLEARGVHGVTDLQQNAPSLTITQNLSKNPLIYIRGMGQRTDVSLFDPSVGLYLNSILIARHDAAFLDTVDVQSMEVLRGPQGTLFGKNNVGGAILITSKKPDLANATGEASTRLGNYGREDFRLSGNLPIIEDKLGMRFVLNKTNLDGVYKNEVDDKMFGDENRRSASLSVLWNVSDSVTAEFFGYTSRTRERGLGNSCVFLNPKGSLSNLSFPGQPSMQDACMASQEAGRKGNVMLNTSQSHFELDNNITALSLNWDINNDLSMSSITSWSWAPHISRSDDSDSTSGLFVASGVDAIGGAYAANGLADPHEYRKQLTEELKLSGSAFDEKLHFTGGLFGSSESINQTVAGSLVGAGGLAGVGPALFPTNDPARIPVISNWSGSYNELANNSYAAFGELSYSPVTWVELTLGGRYTSELRQRTIQTSKIDTAKLATELGTTANYLGVPYLLAPIPITQFNALPYTAPPLTDYKSYNASERFDQFTPSATVTVFASGDWLDKIKLDSLMSYFTYSEGFKAGGFDVKNNALITVNPETVKNYELGLKSDAFEHRLRMNVSLFTTEWSNMQVQVAEAGVNGPTDIQTYFSNAGAATIQGAEFEGSLSVSNWNFGLLASYLDSHYDKFKISVPVDNVPTVVDRGSEPLYSAPQYSYTLSAEYNWQSPIGPIAPRLSYYFRDKSFMGYDYQSAQFSDSWADQIKLLNLRIAFTPSESFRAALYVDNITDENYVAGGISVPASLGAAMVTLGAPRTYGVEAAYSF